MKSRELMLNMMQLPTRRSIFLFLVVGLCLSHLGTAQNAGLADSNTVVADAAVTKQFNLFVSRSGKAYPDLDTFNYRLKVFAMNVAFIEEFNANMTSGSLRLGVNQFADLTASEFKKMYLSQNLLHASSTNHNGDRFRSKVNNAPPESVDWRAKGAVTSVKDQKNCGACWAFSAIGAIEGAWFLAKKSLMDLSVEELLDCTGGKDRGCSGGDPFTALDWVAKNGVCTNKSYPWTGFQDECHNQFQPCQPAAHISGFKHVQSYSELELKAAVAQQPVSVQVEADSDVFRLYKGGILKGSGCGTSLDHAVLAVGYGTDNGQDYWLVKNSWGAAWGEHGYIRIARTNSTASYGECGIAIKAAFPVVDSDVVVV